MTDDRKFGLSLTLALAVVGGLFCWRGHPTISLIFGIAGAVTLAGLFSTPGLMKYPRAALRAVGWLNSRLILALVFYLVFTPVGLVRRIIGQDPLDRDWKKKRESYWIPREKVDFDPTTVEKQY